MVGAIARWVMILALWLGVTTQALGADAAKLRIELLSSYASVAPNGQVWLGVRLTPAKGWHTYWINPGDTGLPTEVGWDLPAGVSAGPLQWPTPDRLPYAGGLTYGYARQSTLLARLNSGSAVRSGSTLPITAHVHALVCADVCEPVDVDVRLMLKVAKGAPALNAGRLQAALDALPKPLDIQARANRSQGRLRVAFQAPAVGEAVSRFKTPAGAYLFLEHDSLVTPTAPQIVTASSDGFVIDVSVSDAVWPNQPQAAVVRFADGAAYRVNILAPLAPAVAETSRSDMPWAGAAIALVMM